MATIRMQGANVLLKGGAVSCECCEAEVPLIACSPSTRVFGLLGLTYSRTIEFQVGNDPEETGGEFAVKFTTDPNTAMKLVINIGGSEALNTGFVLGVFDYTLPKSSTIGFASFTVSKAGGFWPIGNVALTCPTPPP